jgi:adenine deaminase
VQRVIKKGRIVFGQGSLPARPKAVKVPIRATPAGRMGKINIRPFEPGALAVSEGGDKIRVIGLVPDQILTKQMIVAPRTERGLVVSDPGRDILKLAVIERHQWTGNTGIGFVNGFGLQKGALASSVAHDSHNIIVVGVSDEDMFAAVKEIERMNGGMAAVCDGKLMACLPLPIAGLMSNSPLKEIAESWQELRRVAQKLGSVLPEPFMALSFLALPVIPELRLTDRGLVDVTLFRPVSLFSEPWRQKSDA